MLDTETRRRIDTARDILVGKVPDPKSQVEQITIALIYKFMDDMDAESEELGGVRKFFAGEFARYGWAKLMRSGLGGYEMLNLYAEAIDRMPENPGIPLLFQEIFKNAYLPYRDPETLRAFLKIIDEFAYDHSERLGDAFEYLLSVLGSQGDAGQFRTPRHIIDFIVAIIDPKKDETVLDPACGTAGFLISAYKHILKANTDQQGHSTLTPDDRARLARNFVGYDISPDMVRLSLVNMYLHGFPDPRIYEYDTLTSDERWNEYYDVILANPPFMSPKGGIKPHKRFSIQAKRSEVLFVDYMAEHLKPTGRAGFIVPEGIIFQSQTAYRDLRKMLVENSLIAVISLPAGVFNPYSGVKTSILILDKSLARQSDTIAFFKVQNDGYGLGAQRREIDKNDLPRVKAEITQIIDDLRSRRPVIDIRLHHGLLVSKARISANSDFNLSGDRYRESAALVSSYPFVPLGHLFTRIGNGVNVQQTEARAKYRVTRIQTISDGSVNLTKTKFTDDEVKADQFLKWGDILLSHINSYDHLGKTAIFLDADADVVHGINLVRLVPDTSQIDPLYAIRVFKSPHFIGRVRSFAQKAVNQASVKTSDIRSIAIPLPPLDVQKEIVAEIEGYQKVIDGARAVVENYRPHIPIDPAWPMVTLGDVTSLRTGTTPDTTRPDYYVGNVPFVKTSEIANCEIWDTETKLSEIAVKECGLTLFPAGTVLMAMYGQGKTRGQVAKLRVPACTTQNAAAITPNPAVDSNFLYYFLHGQYGALRAHGIDGHISHLNLAYLRRFRIPLPPRAKQERIVCEIEAEQALVVANRELIARFEKKIQSTLARIWDENTGAEGQAVDEPRELVASVSQ